MSFELIRRYSLLGLEELAQPAHSKVNASVRSRADKSPGYSKQNQFDAVDDMIDSRIKTPRINSKTIDYGSKPQNESSILRRKKRQNTQQHQNNVVFTGESESADQDSRERERKRSRSRSGDGRSGEEDTRYKSKSSVEKSKTYAAGPTTAPKTSKTGDLRMKNELGVLKNFKQ